LAELLDHISSQTQPTGEKKKRGTRERETRRKPENQKKGEMEQTNNNYTYDA